MEEEQSSSTASDHERLLHELGLNKYTYAMAKRLTREGPEKFALDLLELDEELYLVVSKLQMLNQLEPAFLVYIERIIDRYMTSYHGREEEYGITKKHIYKHLIKTIEKARSEQGIFAIRASSDLPLYGYALLQEMLRTEMKKSNNKNKSNGR